jgi:hypothetical protein
MKVDGDTPLILNVMLVFDVELISVKYDEGPSKNGGLFLFSTQPRNNRGKAIHQSIRNPVI